VDEIELIVRDPKTGLFDFRLEMGRGPGGTRMQARRTGFATRRAAEAEYRRLCRQRDSRLARPRPTGTMQALCDGWLQARRQELEPNTVHNYRWLLGLIYPFVGGLRASRLTARTVERAYGDLESSGISRTTLRTLDLVLSKAYVEQTGHRLKTRKPRPADELHPVWTLDEARQFLDHVRDDRLYTLWRLLLVTGLRRGELCGLRWIDLDTVLGTLHICRQRVVEEPSSQVREKRPKSENGDRKLILDEQTLSQLLRAKATATSPYVFTGRTGLPLRPDNLTSRFNQLAAAAGVRPIGPHQIRHMLVSSLMDSGYNLHEVAERLGHDPATLLRYYARVHAGRRARAADNAATLVTPDPAGR
jgi:integrase